MIGVYVLVVLKIKPMNHNYLKVIVCLSILPIGAGIAYSQTFGPEFLQCPSEPLSLSVPDEGVRLPANNQVYLGEGHQDATSCSVHVTQKMRVRSTCGTQLVYEVQLFMYDTSSAFILKAPSEVTMDSTGEYELSFDTEESPESLIRLSGLPYTTGCHRYHRVKWIVRDTCGGESICESRIDLFDGYSPVVSNPFLFIVPVSVSGVLKLVAEDYIEAILDDCTDSSDFLFSLNRNHYQPDSIMDPCDVGGFGILLPWDVWVADQGRDLNCDGEIEWEERNILWHSVDLVVVDQGSVDCWEDPFLSGKIVTIDEQGIEKVTVSLHMPGYPVRTYVTIADGKYYFDFLPTGINKLVIPERDDFHKNGVTTLDLVRIQKHLLGREPITNPYLLIAGDANNSQHLSAIDMVEIRKLVLGKTTRFQGNQSWRFVPKNYVFGNPDYPWPFEESITFVEPLAPDNYDFIGIKIGDVNFSVMPNAQSLTPRDSPPIALWTISQQQYEANEMVEIPFYLNHPDIIQGFQFTISSPDMEFLEVSSHTTDISIENFEFFDGKLTLSWHDVDGISFSDKDIVFTLKARTISHGSLKNSLRINSDITEAELFTIHEEVYIPLLRVIDDKASGQVTFSPEPNPWKEHTVIPFYLSEPGDVSIEVLTVNGQSIYTHKGSYSSGYNTILLKAEDIKIHGLLLCSIISGQTQSTLKMFHIH